MELKEFIKTAITDITDAISELQGELKNGTVVNPTLPHPIANTTVDVDGMERKIERLDFDVAVNAFEENHVKGEAKAGISVLGAKLGTSNSARESSVSRLVFSIPVVFPSSKIETQIEGKEKALLEKLKCLHDKKS